jgi:very-short-patch-repair endonuclease
VADECGVVPDIPAQLHIDRLIAVTAACQHGVVARRQLLAAGVTRHQIGERLRTGRLHELHRGVYLVGHEVPPRYAPEMAALLVCGRTAVLSHHTAASLWNLLPSPAPRDVCVTIRPEGSAGRPNLEVHRARLDRRDIRHRHRLALTSPPRTVLDLAAGLDEAELESLVAEGHYRNLARESELRAQLIHHPRKPGSRRLRRVLDLQGGPQRTRSDGERAMLGLLREAGITGFECNARIHGYEVDFLWRQRGLALEVDGWDGHSGRVAFERDRLKAATLSARGIAVMPVTGRQIRDDPSGVLARLLGALA